MAITNSVGYTFINTVLRKELNGNPITIDKYNNLLNFAFEEKLSDEYSKFELNQKSTDFFRLLKRTEVINTDRDGTFDISSLSDSYWHVTGVTYSNSGRNIKVDVVSDSEWNYRKSSSMELPDEDFPICKIDDEKIEFYPSLFDISPNLVTNAGYDGDTDWDDPISGLADDWVALGGTVTNQITRSFNFDGKAQGFGLYVLNPTLGMYVGSIFYQNVTDMVPGRYTIYFEWAITDEGGVDTGYVDVLFNNLSVISTPTVTYQEPKSLLYGTFDYHRNASAPGISFRFANTTLNTTKYAYVDKVYVGVATDIILNYIKTPSTPYMDWYYDANDRIKFLSEGQEYTLLTGERYIDKDDGTVRTATYLITALENKTREMEIPDDDRRGVFYSILSKLGVPLNKLDATQYSMQMESKENMK